MKTISEWEVLTPSGYKDFRGVVKKVDSSVRLEFDNTEITCSPEHRLKTSSGWRAARLLKENDTIETSVGVTKVLSASRSEETIELFDLFDVRSLDHAYFTNDLISHNCSFIGSAGTLISGAVLKTLKAQHPIQSDLGLRMFEEPRKDRQYAITVDVSRGKLLDYSAFNVIDITEMPYRQVCTYRSNTVTPLDYCGVIFRTAKGYNEASVLVEINDIGGQVADSLAFDYEYENVIYTENAGGKGKRISGGFGNNVDRGIRTTKTVKTIGCSMLKLLVEQRQLIINDEQTIEELSRFSKKGASYEAEQGATDDLVMGLVLFGWLSDQQYFKELTNIETLQRLRDKTDDELDESVTPFGFMDDGDHGSSSGIIDLVQSPGHPEFRNF